MHFAQIFRSIAFGGSILISLVSTYAEDREQLLAKGTALRPIEVDISYREVAIIGSDTMTTDGECRVRFDGKRLGYLADLSKATPYPFNKQEAIFADGEIVRISERRASREQENEATGGSAIRRVLTFQSKKEHPERFSAAGEVVRESHCPMVGCFDGFFLLDYFPSIESSAVERTRDVIEFSSESILGKVVCKVDPARGFLPVAFEATKSSACYTNGGRILSSVLFDTHDKKSALNKKTISLRDVIIEPSPAGGFYIDRCTIVQEDFSERGLEARFVTEFSVSAINLRPKTRPGTLQPELRVTDGERFLCEGASQLPYAWSDNANWVIPMARPLDATAPIERSRYFLVVVSLLLLTCVAVWLVWLRK